MKEIKKYILRALGSDRKTGESRLLDLFVVVALFCCCFFIYLFFCWGWGGGSGRLSGAVTRPYSVLTELSPF